MRKKIRNPLEYGIRRRVGEAIGDYALIGDGDRILVALSGGKDSWTLVYILRILQERAPVSFDLLTVTVHPGFPGFRADILGAYLTRKGIPHHIEHTNIYDIVREKAKKGKDGGIRGGDFCAFCSRLRRGVLYRLAREKGCTKIALGHHADDVIETLLLNLFFEGRMETMIPRFISEDGLNTIIRPLYYVWEEETAAYSRQKKFPVIDCCCPVCSEVTMKRKQVKALLRELEREHHGIKTSLLSACFPYRPSVMIGPLPPIRLRRKGEPRGKEIQ